MIGQRVGSYRVVRELGSGGMGTIYLVEHFSGVGIFFALKVLREELVSRDLKLRFEQEARIAARIGSDRAVKPIDFGTLRGQPWILFEYVEGRTLSEELTTAGAFSLRRALLIAERLADVVAIMHGLGFVHRDLKPSNVMLRRRGAEDEDLKLLDFGIARPAGDARLATTHDAAILGTPGYMAPEAWTGAVNIDARADVWSLGVILYRMLTGMLPHTRPENAASATLIYKRPPAPASQLRPRDLEPIPSNVDAILSHALVIDSTQRLSMAQMERAIRAAINSLDGRAPDAVPLVPMSIEAAPGKLAPEATTFKPGDSAPGSALASFIASKRLDRPPAQGAEPTPTALAHKRSPVPDAAGPKKGKP